MTTTPPTVIVLGSLHYDIMLDAPGRPRKGETVTGRSWRPKCGGKGGNQAVAAARQGVSCRMLGAVGRDDFGDVLLANLDKAGVERTNVAIIEGAASGMSVAIFDDEGDYGAVIVSGANLSITPDRLAEAVHDAEVLVMQNEVPEAINHAAAAAAQRRGMRTILNAAPVRSFATALPNLVDLLVVNAIEAEMLEAGTVTSAQSAMQAARILKARFPAVVVTAGGDGVAYADRHGVEHLIQPIKVKVASTHGAGDTFVGTLAAELACGADMLAALEAANRAAAELVATPEADR